MKKPKKIDPADEWEDALMRALDSVPDVPKKSPTGSRTISKRISKTIKKAMRKKKGNKS